MKKRAAKSKNSIKDALTIVPPNAFIIFRTEKPSHLISKLADATKILNERNIGGVILDHVSDIEVLKDEDLLAIGLQRIPRMELH